MFNQKLLLSKPAIICALEALIPVCILHAGYVFKDHLHSLFIAGRSNREIISAY